MFGQSSSTEEHPDSLLMLPLLFFILLFTPSASAQTIQTERAPDRWQQTRPGFLDGMVEDSRYRTLPEARETQLATDSNFTVLGRWAWGPCQAIDVQGSYAYIGNGPTFQVLDISTPQTPTIVGKYLVDELIYDIKIRDTLAFLATESYLVIVNIGKPQQPTRVGRIFFSSGPTRVAPVDSFAYVATFFGTLRVVDVSNPAAPYFRGSINVGGERPWCLAARGRTVYVGNNQWPGLLIVDARNPDAPTGTYFNINGQGVSAVVRDTLLFVGGGATIEYGQFQIYSISNPLVPSLIGQTNVATLLSNAIAVGGQSAFYLTNDSGVVAIDITNLQQPQVRGLFRRPLRGIGFTALAVSGTDVFVADYDGMRTINIENLDSLRLTSFFPTGGTAEKVFLRDSLAFVASGYSGLWILNVSNPLQPRPVGNILTGGGYASDVVVADSFAYLVNWVNFNPNDTARGLWIVDIATPAQPRIVSHYVGIVRYPNILAPNRLALQGNLLLMAQPDNPTNDATLEIIDVNDPSRPMRLSVYRGQYSLADIAIRDSIAYLARSDSGLKIVDLHNPASPVLLSSLFSSFARGVVTRDNFTYVDRVDTLFVIDITNPSLPQLVGRGRGVTGSSVGRDMAISQNYVYSVESRLASFDVSNATAPVLSGIFQKRFGRGGVDAHGSQVIVSDGAYGVWNLRNDLITSVDNVVRMPTHLALFQNFPNPFNPLTTIEFSTAKTENAMLAVYNVLGERIALLLNTHVHPGKHRIQFDGSRLPTGLYFYRLTTSQETITRKMLILK